MKIRKIKQFNNVRTFMITLLIIIICILIMTLKSKLAEIRYVFGVFSIIGVIYSIYKEELNNFILYLVLIVFVGSSNFVNILELFRGFLKGQILIESNDILKILQVFGTIFLGLMAYKNGKIANDMNIGRMKREDEKEFNELKLSIIKFHYIQKNIRLFNENLNNNLTSITTQMKKMKDIKNEKDIFQEYTTVLLDFKVLNTRLINKLEFICIEYDKNLKEFSDNSTFNPSSEMLTTMYTQYNHLVIAKQNCSDIEEKVDGYLIEINSASVDSTIKVNLAATFESTIQLSLDYVCKNTQMFKDYHLEYKMTSEVMNYFDDEDINMFKGLHDEIKKKYEDNENSE
ncbi:hypothetical protein [Helicovermis profundi]|uniref:Uncharacterized protein n=1 Tax=Helicovermis profundi TaxID=3065157 RepID=A0AAU9EVS6_9FIRM|nr:hypothetical protein HLPR_15260 [Clostridia bacterium S502]